jgi:hypothetical protein
MWRLILAFVSMMMLASVAQAYPFEQVVQWLEMGQPLTRASTPGACIVLTDPGFPAQPYVQQCVYAFPAGWSCDAWAPDVYAEILAPDDWTFVAWCGPPPMSPPLPGP